MKNYRKQYAAQIVFNPVQKIARIIRGGCDEASRVITINKVTPASEKRISEMTFQHVSHLFEGQIFVHNDRIKY